MENEAGQGGESKMRGLYCMLVIALALLASGCGTSGENGSQAQDQSLSEQDLLSFTVVYPGGDLAHKQGIAAVIADFEKSHPNIVIHEINETWSGTYAEFLKMKDAVGEFPDLVEMRDTQLFADAGLLAELPSDIAGLQRHAPEVNGRVYTAPLEIPAPVGIIYNKELFRQAGLRVPPETYGEFIAYCEKIRELGVEPIVVGGKDLWHMGFWVNKFLIDEIYMKQPNWNADRNAGKVSWTDAAPLQAMMKLKALWDDGYVAQGFLATADSQTASALISGQAAMLYSGPWMFNQIRSSNPSFSFGFFPLPDSEGRVNVGGAPNASGWSISAKVESDPDKMKAIKQFLHFFYSQAEYSSYLQAVNGISAIQSDVQYPVSEQMKEVLRIMNDPATGQSYYLNYFTGGNAIPPQFRDWFYRMAQDLVSGKLDLKTALIEADKEWDRELQAMTEP